MSGSRAGAGALSSLGVGCVDLREVGGRSEKSSRLKASVSFDSDHSHNSTTWETGRSEFSLSQSVPLVLQD